MCFSKLIINGMINSNNVCVCVAQLPSMPQTVPFVWLQDPVALMLVINNEDFSTDILERVI